MSTTAAGFQRRRGFLWIQPPHSSVQALTRHRLSPSGPPLGRSLLQWRDFIVVTTETTSVATTLADGRVISVLATQTTAIPNL